MPSGGGGQSVQTSSSQVNLTPEQQHLLSIMMPGIEAHLNKPVDLPPGSQVAGFTDAQKSGQQQLLDLSKPGGALSNIGTSAQSALTALLGGGSDSGMSPETQAAITRILGMTTPDSEPVNGTMNVNASAKVNPIDMAKETYVGAPAAVQGNYVGAPAAAQGTYVGAPAPVRSTTAVGGDITNTPIAGIRDTGVNPNALAGAYSPAVNTAVNAAAQLGPGQLQQTNPELAKAMSFLLGGDALNPNSNPALGATIDAAVRPVAAHFNETVLPGIRTNAINNGQLGSNREGIAQGIASKEFLAQIGDIAAKISTEGYGQGLQAMTSTVGGTQTAATQQLATLLQNEATRMGISADTLTKTLTAQLQAETQRQATEQGALTADMQGRVTQEGNLLAANTQREGQAIAADTARSATAINANTTTQGNVLAADTARSATAINANVAEKGNVLNADTQRSATAINANVATQSNANTNNTQRLGDIINAETQRQASISANESQRFGDLLTAETARKGQVLTARGQQAATQGSTLTSIMQNQAANRGLTIDSMMKGLTSADKTAILQTLPAVLTSGVGDLQQAMDQAHLSEDAQKFVANQMKDFAAIQDVASLFFGTPGGTTSTSTGPGRPDNTVQNIASIGTMLAALIAS